MSRGSVLVGSFGVLFVCTLGSALPAQAPGKNCEELRTEIAARISLPKDSYRLEIVPSADTGEGKTMGTCEMGSRKVVFYNSGTARSVTAQAPSTEVPAKTSPSNAATGAGTATAVPPEPRLPQVPSVPAARQRPADESTLGQYRTWIAEARAKHPYADSEDRMLEVMKCESGANAAIVNRTGPNYGLFQYAAQTWRGAWNIYRDADILDARAQIFATALAWEKKMQGQWGCYKRAH